MHALFILSIGAVALGGSIVWGSFFFDFSKSSRSRERSSSSAKSKRKSEEGRRVAVYEFTEFDSETSV